jgi:hypothetical protein
MFLRPKMEARTHPEGLLLQVPDTSFWKRTLCIHETCVQYRRRTYGPRPAGDSGIRTGIVCTRCALVIGGEFKL